MNKLHSSVFIGWIFLVQSILLCSSFASQVTSSGKISQSAPCPKLIDATLGDLRTGLDSGIFTSVDLVNAYIARIKEVNDTLHVVTEINPDALKIASALDANPSNGHSPGPLYGIPILIKNNINTYDKMNNTAGSFALLGAQLPADATIAAKLRKAGAIILGKANMSQWASFRSLANTTNGWSAYGGQAFGAYYPSQDPQGSSSGSAVGTALGLAFAALGTETDGSILFPSENGNVVGIKPTVGLTSRHLIIPVTRRQDSPGTIGRQVKDAAYLLQAIAGRDSNDNYTSAQPFATPPNYTAACKLNAFKGARIGIPHNLINWTGSTNGLQSAFEKAVKLVESAGATVIMKNATNAAASYGSGTSNVTFSVAAADFLSDLPGKYLSKLRTNPQNVHDLQDVSKFTQTFPPEQYPLHDTEAWDFAIAQGFNGSSAQAWAAYQQNLLIGGSGGITGLLRNHSLDAIMLPTDFAPTLTSLIGSPVITVPLGSSPNGTALQKDITGTIVQAAPGFPFGLSFLGDYWTEEKLIGYAYAFEQRTKVRQSVKPYIQPHTDLADIVSRRNSTGASTVM